MIPSPWTPQGSYDWISRNVFVVLPDNEQEWAAGWYFYDEVWSEHGPFMDQDEAIATLLDYCEMYL